MREPWLWLVLSGRNRIVLLVGGLALKMPSPRCWRDLLFGILNNLNERDAHREEPEGRCPVLWCAPGGLLLVMRRVRVLTEREAEREAPWRAFMGRRFSPEPKADSFGWLDGRIVAVDYGW